MSDLLQQVLKRKKEANDPFYPYSLTPPPDDDNWGDAVFEGRGRGIPIASFGDTSDKKVIHPGHLGYTDFHYYWGDWSYGDECWDWKAVEKPMVREANETLFRVCHELNEQGYRVDLVRISGSGNGYLSTTLWTFDQYGEFKTLEEFTKADDEKLSYHSDVDDDFVLFVYGL